MGTLDPGLSIRDLFLMHDVTALEDLAAQVLHETGFGGVMHALHLAKMCGLEVREWDGERGALVDDVVLVNPRLSTRAFHAVVAHETAHWLLRDEGIPDSEAAAIHLSHALLLPRARFDRDLRTTWNPAELQAAHIHAPASWVVRRIAHLRPATATIVDNLRIVERIASKRLPARARTGLTIRETELVAAALHTGRPAGGRAARGWAVPVISAVRRVVVVAETRGLAA